MTPDFKTALKERARIVEEALPGFIGLKKGDPPRLYQAMAHIPLAGGKRLRPVMTLLTNELVGGDPQQALPYGCALEMVHNFTLIHDDIMDDDDLRHGADACHITYDMNTAINAGDALFAQAFKVAAETPCEPDRVAHLVRKLAQIVVIIAEGQQMDMDFETQEVVKAADYLEMVRRKTAVIFGLAAYSGALIGGATEEQAQSLYEMAEGVGLGFQIWDDVIDATVDSDKLGKPTGSDIRQGKRTLLVLTALERATPEQAARLTEILDRTDNTEAEVAEAVQIMRDSGAIDLCTQQALDHAARAREVLASFPAGPARDVMAGLVDYLVERSY